jgi:hypothetical protein
MSWLSAETRHDFRHGLHGRGKLGGSRAASGQAPLARAKIPAKAAPTRRCGHAKPPHDGSVVRQVGQMNRLDDALREALAEVAEVRFEAPDHYGFKLQQARQHSAPAIAGGRAEIPVPGTLTVVAEDRVSAAGTARRTRRRTHGRSLRRHRWPVRRP